MTEGALFQAKTTAGETVFLNDSLPLLPVRDAVVFPGMTIPLAVGRQASLAALDAAGAGGLILVATQRDPEIEEPVLHDLYRFGCIGRIVRIVDTRADGRQAIIVGLLRAELLEVVSSQPYPSIRLNVIDEPREDDEQMSMRRKEILDLAHRVIDLRQDYPSEWKQGLSDLPNSAMLSDLLASNLPLSTQERVDLVSEGSPMRRLEKLTGHLEREVTIGETQLALKNKAKNPEQPEERERLLRKRMRDIQKELGESDPGQREVDDLRDRLEVIDLPEEAREQSDREIKRLASLPAQAPDRHLIRTYLEWILDLPWSVEKFDHRDLTEARHILETDHHGIAKVKERVLEFLAVRKLAPEAKAPILCFVGPPGVGKTSLGKSIADATGREFTRTSLGGVRDEAEIRGHRRTYVGSMPGRILQNLRRIESRNPVFLLDEIDKIGSDYRGDPSSALLEVLDPEQNDSFCDHYLEIPFDLSKILFIATANSLATIPDALLDRMEIIELPGYTQPEKIEIARKHLIPKQVTEHGLEQTEIDFKLEAIEMLVGEFTREAGVRSAERQIASLMRKVATRIVKEKTKALVTIDTAFVRESLGAPPHLPHMSEETKQAGVVVGLAATSHGGDILFVEATTIPGGREVKLRLTGQLGDTMRESAETAFSWVRANAKALELSSETLSGGEIHIHVPEGAVPKDGPSAGIALASAMVSVLSGKTIRGTLAMTGEISLRGRVLAVGGIKDKLLAAERSGIETVLIPRRNEKDLVEVPDHVRESLRIIPVDAVGEVLEHALKI